MHRIIDLLHEWPGGYNKTPGLLYPQMKINIQYRVETLIAGVVPDMSNPGGNVPGGGVTGAAAAQQNQQVDSEKIFQWIIELASPDTRENALLELR